MLDRILTIQNVPVVIAELPSGDLKVWHPFNEQVRQLVEPLCRGRGRWHPKFNNWIVFSSFKHEVIAALHTLERAHHD